jgi:hypothetical protein
MAFSRQQVRRGRCRDVIRQALRSTALVGAGPLHANGVRREVYLRFAAGGDHPDTKQPRGIFHVGDLLAHPELTHAQREVLDGSRRWFNENLCAPDLDEPRAIFWFRPGGAGECVSRVWERVALLREHGIVVHLLRCTDPGLVVYRDRQQIAAVPQRKTRWRYRLL